MSIIRVVVVEAVSRRTVAVRAAWVVLEVAEVAEVAEVVVVEEVVLVVLVRKVI